MNVLAAIILAGAIVYLVNDQAGALLIATGGTLALAIWLDRMFFGRLV